MLALGINQGAALTSAPLILLLNPDARLLPGAVGPLVAELQRQVSEGLLNAELQHMDTRGRARAGFSSLWGRFGGIWVNPAG